MLSSDTANKPYRLQGYLWGRNARDWFEIQERQSQALYDIILKALNLTLEQSLLDAGCGAGLFCEMAAKRGTTVMGIDASAALLDFAQKRAPRAVFFEGDLEAMPFVENTFDVVTLLNCLHHIASPHDVLIEARRVLRAGGRAAIAAWGRPEECAMAAVYRAIDELLPVASPSTPAAFAFSDDDAMRKLVARAGLAKQLQARAVAIWSYADETEAMRGLLSTSSAAQAVDCAGEERVRKTVKEAIAPFRLPRGGYRMENAFHYVIAQRS